MKQPDEKVVAKYVAEVKNRVNNGENRYTALNAVLKERLPKDGPTEDVWYLKSVLQERLSQELKVPTTSEDPVPPFVPLSREARVLGGGIIRNRTYDFLERQSGEQAEDRRDQIAEEFRSNFGKTA